MEKILVTGGAGFIGSRLTNKLIKKGIKVVVVDDFNNYYDSKLKRARVKFFFNKNVKVYEKNISNYKSIEEIFKKEKITKVCNLAAQAGVRHSLDNPFIYEKTNNLGVLNLLELCRHYKVKDFIYASSSSVYGNNKKMPFKEIDRIDTPISLYAATKNYNEKIAFTYHHLFGINCTGLRFFTVYGPWGRPDMALFKFTKNILNKKPIDVYNNGKMYRDFTYIDDIVNGVMASLEKSCSYEIFNLARGESVKLMEYIKAIEDKLNIKAKINFLPMQPGDVPATSADISKAKKILKYNPKVSVKEGVFNFIDWYKKFYH